MSKEARSFLPLVVLLLAAFWLRLYRLDAQSLWWDEGISLHLATSSAAEIVRDRLANIHPPLYFFLLKGWLRLVGVSPFTGRALSVLAGLLQVALAFAAAGYWSRRAGLGPRIARAAGWLAGGLMLLSPLSVIYSQEMRVYALLPVAYLLLLLLAGRWLAAGSGQGWPRLWALAAVAWLGLHLHYIALFAVAYVGAWGALVLLRRGDGRALRRWLLAHAVVAVASLPWLLAVLANWPAVRAEAAAGTYTTEPAPLPFLLAQVWTFHLTGLAGSLGSPLVRWLAAGAAIALGLSLAAVACAPDERGGAAGGRPLGRAPPGWAVCVERALVFPPALHRHLRRAAHSAGGRAGGDSARPATSRPRRTAHPGPRRPQRLGPARLLLRPGRGQARRARRGRLAGGHCRAR